jgi:hypothetical protein
MVRRLEGNWFACNARTAGTHAATRPKLGVKCRRRSCVRGDEVGFVAEELKGIFDPRAGQRSDGRHVLSDAAPQMQSTERGQGRRLPHLPSLWMVEMRLKSMVKPLQENGALQ